MGLDQYAFAVMPSKDNTDFKWVWTVAEATEGKITEIAYWRKHPNLQGWMENLWLKKRAMQGVTETATEGLLAGEVVFNCEPIRLTVADLDLLESAVKGEILPETEGFFFGDNSDEYYKEADLKFIEDARTAILQDMEVYYYSWW